MYRNSNIFRIFLAVAVLLSLTVGMVAAVPVTQNITYQGKLTDAAGNPLTGAYSVTFGLYEVSSLGHAVATDTHSVTASKGLFTTQITAAPELFDGRALWLGIKLGADPEMTPRQELRPVPYALSLRPGAWITSTDGFSVLNLQNKGGGRALNVSTTGVTSDGVWAYTIGSKSIGVKAQTSGSESPGVHATTSGAMSAGVRADTTGDNSNGVYADTIGASSHGVKTQTSGAGSNGVWAITSGANSTGVYAYTTGDNSRGVVAATDGTNSDGVDAYTIGSKSIGVKAQTSGSESPGVRATTSGAMSAGVRADTTGDNSNGVYADTIGASSHGVKTQTSGAGSNGVWAITSGANSAGVYAYTTGDNSRGVVAATDGTKSDGVDAYTSGANSRAIYAHTTNTYSDGIDVRTDGVNSHGLNAQTYNTDSYGVYAYSAQGTAIWADTGKADHLYGVQTPDYMKAARYDTGSSDVAEYMPVSGDVAPGTVLVIGKGGILAPSSATYDTHVAGIVSTEPGVTLGTKEGGNHGEALIAVSGRVPCKVDASNGVILEGDLLTTSLRPGYAMRADPVNINGIEFYRPGTILGKAMGTLETGTGTIEVLVTLQ